MVRIVTVLTGQSMASSNGQERRAQAAGEAIGSFDKGQIVVLLRWVLIISTSYLVLFSRPLRDLPLSAALFVALYLASNVILTELLPRLSGVSYLDWIIVVMDTVALSIAMILTQHASSEFFVLYFVVVFLSALTERIGLVAIATLLIATAYLYTVAQFAGVGFVIDQGYMMRVPFLFTVALFFGYLVQSARARERANQEARARALRMELLSAVSHDLKNPLGVIESLASLMLEGDAGILNEQQTDLTERIHASSRQVITLSLNLIDAERIEAGRLTLNRRRADIAKVADNALVYARSASHLKGIALLCQVEPALPLVQVDAAQIELVISNVLGNAIKFTPPGGQVKLAIRRRGDAVVVAVSDTGPGIAADELPYLFDKYHRESRSHRIEGSGLGLFIVKAVSEAHGGKVDIASALGRGTTVAVTLPIESAKTEGSTSLEAWPSPTGSLPLAASQPAGSHAR
jgi:signal transduction histidine kinase